MSAPLSDTRLTAIRGRVPSAVCPAAHPAEADKGHVWVTGSLSGADRCSACSTPKSALDSDEAVLLAEVDRLRAVVADHEGEVVRYDADHERLSAELARLRGLLAPAELATWAEQLQSAGLIPHPAFACRSTTSGYEAAFQVATTDALTAPARERLLTELQVAFDETVCRVLGYRPATATSEPTCGVLNPKVAATCTEPNDHPSPIHRDAFGNTWTRREGERPLSIPTT